jgi:hypothetical protein
MRTRIPFKAVALLLASLAGAATLTVAAAERQKPVTLIAYGDTRFTDPSNVTATNPRAREVLITRIAEERPNAILVTGDLPWNGGVENDYDVFRAETEVWRARKLQVIPALGNHEFSKCQPEACLENWWNTFPALRGKRWYSTAVAPVVRVIAVDTMSSLTPGSEQRAWLEHEIATLPASVQFAVIILHHPPVADIQTRLYVDHNPRPNELALAEYLKGASATSHARLMVIAGHIHNYERFLQDDVAYLVCGGGGAVPYYVDRTDADLYKNVDFPNFHYVKLTIVDGHLKGEMYRLDEPTAPTAHFTLKDTFDLAARSTT